MAGQLWAQRAPMENTFLSVAGGLNGYKNAAYGAFENQGAHLELAVGYHLSNDIAFRARLSGMTNVGAAGTTGTYLYGMGDLMWNLTNSFFGFNYYRRSTLSAFLGFGLVHATGDNDFALSLGLHGETVVTGPLRAFAELKAMVHPSEFDDNERMSFAPMASVGLSLLMNENAFFNAEKSGMPHANSDWYVGLGVLSATSMQYAGIESMGQRMRQVRPSFNFALGKRLTPCWNGRFSLGIGLAAYRDVEYLPLNPEPQLVDYNFNFATLQADLMLDLTQAVLQRRYMQKFSLYPYLGTGLLMRFDHADELRLALNAGLSLRYILTSRGDLFLDARYALTESRFTHVEGYPQGRFSVGLASLTAGYIINIGESRFRKTF